MASVKARVRMYRLAVGDCFLVSLSADGGHGFHLLIDCGTLKGSPKADSMPAVIADIETECGGTLDAVAVTHEHWDHLSGFGEHPEAFDRIRFANVWMPWTEDPNDPDPVARQLRERYEPGLRALGMAAASNPAIASLLGFQGLGAAGKISKGTREARDYVRNRKPSAQPFLSPGNVLEPLPGVRVYVLGPPRNRKQLARDTPKEGETFEMAARASVEALGAALLDRFLPDPGGDSERFHPFDSHYRVRNRDDQDAARGLKTVMARYESEPERKIDDDWMSSAEELALQMDSDTNNASLVLAIELVESGKVLLFPGDAQVGNWESWHDVTFEVSHGGATKKVTAADLLSRTVLYKVGHHGSHNATRGPGGLDLMKSPDLVALIPTDAEFALGRRPNPWRMPAAGLAVALDSRTQGRVIRADSGVPKPAAKFPGTAKATDLYIDYEIEG